MQILLQSAFTNLGSFSVLQSRAVAITKWGIFFIVKWGK